MCWQKLCTLKCHFLRLVTYRLQWTLHLNYSDIKHIHSIAEKGKRIRNEELQYNKNTKAIPTALRKIITKPLTGYIVARMQTRHELLSFLHIYAVQSVRYSLQRKKRGRLQAIIGKSILSIMFRVYFSNPVFQQLPLFQRRYHLSYSKYCQSRTHIYDNLLL